MRAVKIGMIAVCTAVTLCAGAIAALPSTLLAAAMAPKRQCNNTACDTGSPTCYFFRGMECALEEPPFGCIAITVCGDS